MVADCRMQMFRPGDWTDTLPQSEFHFSIRLCCAEILVLPTSVILISFQKNKEMNISACKYNHDQWPKSNKTKKTDVFNKSQNNFRVENDASRAKL